MAITLPILFFLHKTLHKAEYVHNFAQTAVWDLSYVKEFELVFHKPSYKSFLYPILKSCMLQVQDRSYKLCK